METNDAIEHLSEPINYGRKEENKAILESLNMPDLVVVASASEIKVKTVKKALRILFPDREFQVIGVKAGSEINEQPIDDETYSGAKNRLKNAEAAAATKIEAGQKAAYISIENGLFEGVDKSVVYLKLPDGRVFDALSAGVPFPEEAIAATRETINEKGDRGFTGTTVGEVMKKMGLVRNNQDPHKELTNKAFPRELQMIGALMKVFLDSPKKSDSKS